MPQPYPQPQPTPDPDGKPGPHDPRPDPAPPRKQQLPPPNLSFSTELGMMAFKPVERVTRTFAGSPMLGDAGFIRTGGGGHP